MKRYFLGILGAAFLAGAPAAQAQVKVALDSPMDPKLAGSYIWSKAFADYLESKGIKAKLYKVGSLVRFDVDSRRRRAVAGDASSRPDAPAPRSLTRFPSSTLQ